MATGGRVGDALDGGDGLVGGVGHRRDTSPNGSAVEVHGARTAQAHAATEFGAGQLGPFEDNPEQGHGRIDVERSRLTVKGEGDGQGTRGVEGGGRTRKKAVLAGDPKGMDAGT